MKPLADFMEARSALLLALRDHDEWLRVHRQEPGGDRAILMQQIEEYGAVSWTFEDGTWLP